MSEVTKFSWIPFYEEFAKKLREYKDNRTDLVKKIKHLDDEWIQFIRTPLADEKEFDDIDPFTVFAIFNRSSGLEKRINIIKSLQKEFGLESVPTPSDFDGIPLANAQKSCFYYEKEKKETIPLLWNLFTAFMKRDDFSSLFDSALTKYGIKWNLTMAFFWMKPKECMPLDAKSRNYLNKVLQINVFSSSQLNFKNFDDLQKQIRDLSEKEIYVLSEEAWRLNDKLEVNGLMVQDNSDDWPDELIKVMASNERPGVFWWHEKPVGKDNTIKLLREKLNDDESFDFYLFRNKKAIYKAVVSDFVCTPKDYESKKELWTSKDTQWLANSFEEFCDSDGKRSASILFYVDEMEKLEDPISLDNFVTSKDYKKPHITNLVPFKSIKDLVKSFEKGDAMDLSVYLNLLEANHNIILHGAPGTGKTYLAKEIAKAMDAEYEMVQFHQSYDYTDFVEGLRPAKGENDKTDGFERKDGVFKAFCKNALEVVDSGNLNQYSDDDTEKMVEWFKNQAKSADVEIKSIRSDARFTVKSFDGTLKIVTSNGKQIQPYYSAIKRYLKTKVYNHSNMTYTPAIGQYILDNYPQKSELKPKIIQAKDAKFVFIVDEINRGEMSKIFGELFYSIDPGYRGEKGRINTQYQNLIDEEDVFADGFFVPSNVYIIGTMNDIDRSVESMDFAMRRRFAFKEIKADDRVEMLYDKENGLGDLAKIAEDCMKTLNNAIWNAETKEGIPGLSSAYHIGPAYFLKLRNYAKDDEPFEKLWEYHIEGVLKEYLRGMDDAEGLLEKLRDAYNMVLADA